MINDDFKDLYVETENLIFGRVAFFRMKIPSKWRAYPIPRRTDAELWIDVDGVRWVTNGYTGFILVDEDRGFRQPVYVNVKRNLDGKPIQEIFSGELRDREIIELNILEDYEDALYYVSRRRRRRHLLFGPIEYETILKLIINCRKTYRVLILEFPISSIEDFREKILPYFRDIKC